MYMDARNMSGFSSAVIDSFQYFGGSLADLALGPLIDHVGWGSYFYFMAPFGLIGATLMFVAGHQIAVTPRAPEVPRGFDGVARSISNASGIPAGEGVK